MSDSAINVDRVLDLAGVICDEGASDSEFAETDAYLLDDRLSCNDYLNYCWMHVALTMESRIRCAVQQVHQQIDMGLVVRAIPVASELDVVKIEPPVSPVLVFPSTTLHGTFGYFSSDWTVSYLIATVIMGIGAVIAGFMYVSHPGQVADNSPPMVTKNVMREHVATESPMQFVGRITSMVDCKWAGVAVDSPSVSLGRKYELSSGLIEVTYNTGAKVILQGPVAYVVESKNGGFLPVGKLTGKVEAEKAKGFTVRTPTAIVTDLGTEFGVEVSKEGVTETCVFKGKVSAKRLGRDGRAMLNQTLSAGQAIRIETDRVAMISKESYGQKFIRSMPLQRPLVKFIDPTPYQSFENCIATPNISPFSKAAGGPFGPLSGDKSKRHWIGSEGQYFYLEDLESGEIHSLGLSRMGGRVTGDDKMSDSVDEDDGSIDNANNGHMTHSLWFGGDGSSLTIYFKSDDLGRLPTHVGFVITDGSPQVNTRVEVFDREQRLLAKQKVYNTTFATGDHVSGAGRPEMARFFGIVSAQSGDRGGIGSIVLTPIYLNEQRADQGVEIDHIQYGYALPDHETLAHETEEPDERAQQGHLENGR